jgi:4-hydroxythreonine-4-phosphate dehydrogenase
MSNAENKPIIGISCGDLNGIGMEIILKTFENPQMLEICTPVVFASSKVASYHRNALDKKNFSFNIINNWERLHAKRANLFTAWKEEVAIDLGKESKVAGEYALKSLDHACKALEENKIDALVTAPIHKNTIQSDAFAFTGHTDYLEDRFKAKATMILLSQQMRMALATVHVPIEKVTALISPDLLSEKLETLHQSLRNDFQITRGKIAVLALNPHAGDGGVIGHQDQDLVKPAIDKAFEKGIAAFGPFPADSFFGSGKHQQFDMILAMYHDQGLTPFKALSFGEGVNYSAGLPVVRTSPDHGTALEIAGQGIANPQSFREAVYRAIDLIKNRKIAAELNANPLKTNRKKR